MNSDRTRALRLTAMTIVLVAVGIGAVRHGGTGSLSAFGAETVFAICPLGYLETVLAGREMMPHLFMSFLVVAGLTVLLGRVFCGWICPVPLVRKLLTNKINEGERPLQDSASANDAALLASGNGKTVKAAGSQEDSPPNAATGLVILGVTLGSSAVWGFPVFCLVCPAGLIFATVVALIRLIHFNEPTLDLLAFPAVIIVELVVLKQWCRRFCPLGALLSLFSRFNRTLVPVVDRSLCLEETGGVKCQRCRSACSFDIELKQGTGTGAISDCTKCRECADHCPVQAIRFPWR